MRVSEIEALHCLAMMQHISHSDLTLHLAIPPPTDAAAAAPGHIYGLDLHVDLLCFYATLVLFPLCAMCLSYLLLLLPPPVRHLPPLPGTLLGLLPIAFIACFMEIFRH